MMPWILSHRCDPLVRPLADRHYNRQSVGAANFVPPGRCLVLRTEDCGAFWVTSWPFARFTKHEWAGAWVCSAFRRERGHPASDLIRAAVAATRAKYRCPDLGMVTFIDRDEVRPTMVRGEPVWGWTWLKVGFEQVGETKSGLLAFQLWPRAMPPAEPARGTQSSFEWEAAP